jgi:peptide/nickel transport system permease protein
MSSPGIGETRKTKLPRRLPIIVLIAALIVAVVVVCGVLGDRIAPDSPFLQRLRIGDTPPSASHIAGTDLLVRDVLSRAI